MVQTILTYSLLPVPLTATLILTKLHLYPLQKNTFGYMQPSSTLDLVAFRNRKPTFPSKKLDLEFTNTKTYIAPVDLLFQVNFFLITLLLN